MIYVNAKFYVSQEAIHSVRYHLEAIWDLAQAGAPNKYSLQSTGSKGLIKRKHQEQPRQPSNSVGALGKLFS